MSVVTKEWVITREAVADTVEVRGGVKFIDGVECWSAEKATAATGRPRSTQPSVLDHFCVGSIK